MFSANINIPVANDDKGDCIFFKEAIEELEVSTQLSTVYSGAQRTQYLTEKPNQLPFVLFPDLNMPRENSFACSTEIKRSKKLKSLPVIISSTSDEESIANLPYKNGAQHNICKPADFSQIKKVIHQTITLVVKENNVQPNFFHLVI